MNINTDLLKELFIKYKMEETEIHLNQALDSYEKHNYEAANGQLRTSLESFFNYLAKLLLNSQKTGGQARQQLHKCDYITDNENELLKYFFKFAGENGAHAGKSDEFQSLSNIHVGLGIMTRMIRLFPIEMTVSKVYELAGIDANGYNFVEKDFSTECPTCLENQSIDECKVYVKENNTIYECKNGCQQIIIIAKFVEGTKGMENRGYRLKDYVIRNAKDMIVTIPNAINKVLIPASKNAFRKSHPIS
ncbi:hypothetical protein ACFDTO_22890 [Microbacteriaceae bacterium 4G12]